MDKLKKTFLNLGLLLLAGISAVIYELYLGLACFSKSSIGCIYGRELVFLSHSIHISIGLFLVTDIFFIILAPEKRIVNNRTVLLVILGLIAFVLLPFFG